VDVLLLAPGPGVATRVPVLSCRDALRRGASVEVLELDSDADVDAAIKRAEVDDARLVVAGGDAQLRAVLRRMVRRSVPRGGERPADLPIDRTIPDLPALGVLPLEAVTDALGTPDLVTELGLPRTPEEVAAAVLGGASQRVDLLRHDGGSVTLHGALLGGADEHGRPLTWQARIDVDDAMLADGVEPLLACAIANAAGYGMLAGLPLVLTANPTDGVLDVGVALPVPRPRGLLGRRRAHGEVEVRRAQGRAVQITLVAEAEESGVPLTDDGIAGTVSKKRTWWMERGAWGVYTA
jgi:hypothetical protein